MIGEAAVIGLTVLVFVLMYRAASKPRRRPKVPRDRSQDWQIVPWIGFRF